MLVVVVDQLLDRVRVPILGQENARESIINACEEDVPTPDHFLTILHPNNIASTLLMVTNVSIKETDQGI